MPQVSKQKLSPVVANQVEELFSSAFTYRHPRTGASYINLLFTPTEKTMIAKRIAIAYLLKKGLTYRNLSSLIKVSSTTINRIANLLANKKSGLNDLIDHLMDSRQTHNTLTNFIEKIIPPSKGHTYQKIKQLLSDF